MSDLSETIRQEEIVRAVHSAAQDVFSTMLNLPLALGDPYEDAKEPESFDGVVALVGVAGSWTGGGRVSCSPLFACQLASALLMSPYDAVNEDVLDAVAEVSNMIIGNVKTFFEEKLGPLGLSVPTVIYGRNYRTRSSGVLKWTVVPFHSGSEKMDIRICLMPTRNHPVPVMTHELLHG